MESIVGITLALFFCAGFDVTAAVIVALVMLARARAERERRVGLSPAHGELS